MSVKGQPLHEKCLVIINDHHLGRRPMAAAEGGGIKNLVEKKYVLKVINECFHKLNFST